MVGKEDEQSSQMFKYFLHDLPSWFLPLRVNSSSQSFVQRLNQGEDKQVMSLLGLFEDL